MNATRKIIKEANIIASRYSKWMEPKEFVKMYDELAELGITVGTVYSDWKSCEWYIDGEIVDNSLFCYSTYKGCNDNSIKTEFTVYFS